MAALLLPFPHNPDYPTADHPHERLRQHQTLLRRITHNAPSEVLNPNYPDLDLIDNVDHYLVEVELPGVKQTEDVKCLWASDVSMIVYGVTKRASDSHTLADGDAESTPSPDDLKYKDGPHQLISERRLGTFRRQVYFPRDVDINNETAKLEAGLLTIKVPKQARHSTKHGRVNVNITT